MDTQTNGRCIKCGGKMVKMKYLFFDEIAPYLLNENMPGAIGKYEEWLRDLKENDLVLTLFRREDPFTGIKEKYYLRVVEKKTKNGIKLKGLTRIFDYEKGEILYRSKDNFSPTTIYKIIPINEKADKIIREYSKDKELFDIDELNKIITKAGEGIWADKQKANVNIAGKNIRSHT